MDSYTGGARLSNKLNANKTPDKIWVQGQASSPSKVETPPLNKEGVFLDSPSPGPAMFDAASPEAPSQNPTNLPSFADSKTIKEATRSSGVKLGAG